MELFPPYSVLMSVYAKEQPGSLKASIHSMLSQTIRPSEIILVKDGKLTKPLDEVIRFFEEKEPIIKVISLSENLGLGKALNTGIQYCKNDLVARMDTDDIAMPDRCEKQLRKFMENDKLGVVGSAVAEFADQIDSINSYRRLPTAHNDIVEFAKKRNPFNHPTVMFKKSIALKAGGYQHCPFFEDYDLWIRMIKIGTECANIDEPLVYMRTSSGLFQRRGGYSYMRHMINFRSKMRKLGFITNGQFLVTVFLHGLVSLLPNHFRVFVYRRFLRTFTN